MASSRPSIFLIVNPNARGCSPDAYGTVLEILGRELAVEAALTKAPGHATELAALAADAAPDAVVVFGGDGTVNEAANALAGGDVPLTVIPGGGANILARATGIGRDPEAAAHALPGRLATAAPRRIPLGTVNGRYFVSNCGIGFDAALVRRVESHQRWKRRAGDWYFVWAGIRTFLTGYDRRTPHVTLSWGSEVENHEERQFVAIVQNLDPFTFMGKRPLRICPEVELDAGLDCFSIDSMRARHVIPIVISAFGKAGHARRRHVLSLHDQPRLHVDADLELPLQVDGEFAGTGIRFEIASLPNALAVLA